MCPAIRSADRLPPVFSLGFLVALVLALPTPARASVEAHPSPLQDRRFAQNLMLKAKNEQADPEARRRAVYALGTLRCQEATQFLVDNIAYNIPLVFVNGDGDRLRETPCYLVLKGAKDPSIIPAIFAALDKPRTDEEIVFYGSVLKNQLPWRVAGVVGAALVKNHLDTAANPTRKDNLRRLLDYFSE